jgi:di/tricarboxylate transporter
MPKQKHDLSNYYMRRLTEDDVSHVRMIFYIGFLLMPICWLYLYYTYKPQVAAGSPDRFIVFMFGAEHDENKRIIKSYVSLSLIAFVAFSALWVAWIALYCIYYDGWAKPLQFFTPYNRFMAVDL